MAADIQNTFGTETRNKEIMAINFKERTEAYFNNMSKYEKDIDIHVRFLDKIFKAATDKEYSYDEKLWILKTLINTTTQEKNIDYKILNLCYCYKINKILDSKLSIPEIKSENKLKATFCSTKNIPEKVYDHLKNRPNNITLNFVDSLKPDSEILEIYNVEIAKDHFYF